MQRDDLQKWSRSAASGYSQLYSPVLSGDKETSEGRRQTVGWVFICLIGVWMFVLGLFVGRYTTPVQVAEPQPLEQMLTTRMAAEQAADAEAMTQVKQAMYNEDLEFYDKLRHQQGSADTANSEKHVPASELATDSSIRTKTALTQKPKMLVTQVIHKPEPLPLREKRSTASSESTATAQRTGKFVIQVASFIKQADAEALVIKLKTRGYNGAYQAAEKFGGSIRYRVKIGYFPGKNAAKPALKKVQQKEGLRDAYIIKQD